MRATWTLVHRYLGLLTAGFLFISGVTGAVISWDHELDDLLNPHLMEAHTPGQLDDLAVRQADMVEVDARIGREVRRCARRLDERREAGDVISLDVRLEDRRDR